MEILDDEDSSKEELTTEEDWALFVEKNEEYYVENFRTIANGDRAFSFNSGAGFGGIFWLLYRKMYLFFILDCFVLYAFLVIAIDYIDNQPMLAYIAGCLFNGFLGNQIYFYHIKSKLKKLEEGNSKKKSRATAIKEIGGLDMRGPIIAFVILAILGLFFILLVISVSNGMSVAL